MKENNKQAYETLRYSSYNPRQAAKAKYFDIHPGYRIEQDIWGQAEGGAMSDVAWMQKLFVPTCVRNECWYA